MAEWGRNAGADSIVPVRRRRFGLLSLVCAIVAFAAVMASFAFMVSLPTDVSESLGDAASMTVLVACLVAPVLHLAGTVFGIMALAKQNDSKALGVVGILLNLGLLALGLTLGWAAIGTIGAFT